MKAEVTIKKEVNLTTLNVEAAVRYWIDADVNGITDTENGDNIPCKFNDCWCPIIDIETGVIINWEKGKSANVHYKVVDLCSWAIMSENDGCIASVENDYVPEILCPKENGHGDYIIMDIDANGVIQGWDKDDIFILLTY